MTPEQLATLTRYAEVLGRAWFTVFCATLQLPIALAEPKPRWKRPRTPAPVSTYVPEL